MSTEVGKIHYALDLNTAKFDSASDSIGSKLTSMGKSLAGFAVKAGVAFGAMSVASGTFAIKSASDFEQTRVSIENMLGSADSARKLLKDISTFAKSTPFEFAELAGATKQLIAYGFSAEEAFNTMKNLGDVASAVGTPISDLTYLMGTLKTQGKAMTIDIRQFASRGIPIYKYLAQVLGTTETAVADLVTEGKVGFKEVEKAFQAMTAEGGNFYKTMEKQSSTLAGRWSNFKDIIGITARELVGISETGDIIKGSLFDKISNGLATVVQRLPEFVDKFKGVFDFLASQKYIFVAIFDALANLADGAVKFGQQVAEYLQPKLEALWGTFSEKIIPVLQRLWKDVLEPLLPIIGTVLVFAIGLSINALNALSTASAWLMDKFLILVQWIKNVIDWFGEFSNKVAGVAGAVSREIGNMINWITGVFRSIAITIKGALSGVYEVIIEPFKRAFNWISDQISGLMNKLSSLSKRATFGLGGGALDEAKKMLPPGFAKGGNPPVGVPSLVGEKGPELFIPRTQGTVIPADKTASMMGGSVSIYGNINIGSQQDSDNFFARLSRNQELSSKGLASMAGTV